MRAFSEWLALWYVVLAMASAEVVAQAPGTRPSAGRESPTTPRTMTLHWDQVPLEEATARLAHALQQPIFVDRRIDPGLRVTFSAHEMAAGDVLAALAAELSLGASRLDSVVYLGPRKTAEQLRTLAALRGDEIRRLPMQERKVLLERKERSWPRLAEPRAIVSGLLGEHGWSTHHTELIPHDLWPAGQLPAISLSDQLTLLLAGFDLTFRPLAGQQAIEIVPIRGSATLSKNYRWPAGRMPELETLRRELPGAQLELRGNRLTVDARQEDHEQLLVLLGGRSSQPAQSAPTRSSSTQETEQRYTLRVDNQPVESVLRQLGQQLGWNLHIDRAAIGQAGRSLDERVSFAVDDATVDALLDALLKPAGLTYRLEGKELTVGPRAADD